MNMNLSLSDEQHPVTVRQNQKRPELYAYTSSSHDHDAQSKSKKQKLSISILFALTNRYALSIASRPATHLIAATCLSLALTVAVVTKGNVHFDSPGLGWLTKGTIIANRAAQEELVRERIFTKEDVNYPRDEEIFCSGDWYASNKMLDPEEINLVSIWKISDLSEKSALDADALYEMCMAEEHTLNLLTEEDLCHKCLIENEEGPQYRCIQPYSLVGLARLYLHSLGNDVELGSEHLIPSISCEGLEKLWTKNVQNTFEIILSECTNYMLEKEQLKPATDTDNSRCKNFPIMTASVVDDQFVETGRVKYTSSIFATYNDPSSIETMYYADKANLFHDSPNGTNSTFEQVVYDVGMDSLYATEKKGFYAIYMSEILPRELAIAAASLLIVVACVLIHTASPFLTIIGTVQIILTLPIGYFFYHFILGLSFFPFLNINAVFVVFAVGADDIFVAVDKWKMMRRELPHDFRTEQVAEHALPKIAFATFVSSITTAAAFFASAGNNVPIVSSLAIFSGLVITMDYVLSIVILFPSICIYDRWLVRGCRSRWISLRSEEKWISSNIPKDKHPRNGAESEACRESEATSEASAIIGEESEITDNVVEVKAKFVATHLTVPEDSTVTTSSQVLTLPSSPASATKNAEDSSTALHSSLSAHYKLIHSLRWTLLVLSGAAIIVCSFVAGQIEPPDQINPPILPPSNRYERHRQWSHRLLVFELLVRFETLFIWGSTPADTSHRLDPVESSTLVLNDAFDPSKESVQVYLLEQCDKLLYSRSENNTPFRGNSEGCFWQKFNEWLLNQSETSSPGQHYVENCQGATKIPMPSELFNSCSIAYNDLIVSNQQRILHEDGIVKAFAIPVQTQISFFSPFVDLDREWKAIEEWLERERENAPEEARNFFFSSFSFHVYDTINVMMSSARTSIGITLACASATILLTSQSLSVTLLSTISIGYVLVATIACLVGLGWTLGLFESVLFSIAIGIGCDYVLHVSHSYSILPGDVRREERTRTAVIQIGPSIIGSAFTTISTGIMMMFAENTFSKKFGAILIVTTLQSIIGSFVVFVTLCDCFGPSKISSFFGEGEKKDAEVLPQ